MSEKKQGIGTLALHAGQEPDPATGSRAVPIYATTSFVFKDTQHAADLFALKEFGNIYSRLGNPTVDVFEKRLAALDGGAAALGFASGMAAITASILTIAHAGDNIISATSLYGGTYTLFTRTLPKLGVEVRFFDPADPSAIDSLVDERTRLVYLEGIGNPKNDVADFEVISEKSHGYGVPVILDNTVLTPILFRPIDYGIDIVVYSATKYIGGHGTHVGGAIVDSGRFDWSKNPEKWPGFTKPDPAYNGMIFTEALKSVGNIAYITHVRTHWLRDTGACMSPFAAFLFLQGLETIHLRVPRHAENAEKIAEWLTNHEKIDSVIHPSVKTHRSYKNAQKYIKNGSGPIVGFELKGGIKAGRKLIESVHLASHLANIGDSKTLIIHPASTTHQQLSPEQQLSAGVTPGYIRLCVGIEDVEDIIADLDQALAAV